MWLDRFSSLTFCNHFNPGGLGAGPLGNHSHPFHSREEFYNQGYWICFCQCGNSVCACVECKVVVVRGTYWLKMVLQTTEYRVHEKS